jgi:hypothetical protein
VVPSSRGPVHGVLCPRGTHPRRFFWPCTASTSANGPLYSVDVSKFIHILHIPTISGPRTPSRIPSYTPSRTPSRTLYSNSHLRLAYKPTYANPYTYGVGLSWGDQGTQPPAHYLCVAHCRWCAAVNNTIAMVKTFTYLLHPAFDLLLRIALWCRCSCGRRRP